MPSAFTYTGARPGARPGGKSPTMDVLVRAGVYLIKSTAGVINPVSRVVGLKCAEEIISHGKATAQPKPEK